MSLEPYLNTVEPRHTATSLIKSPRYYRHFLWPHGKNVHTFPCKETLVNFDHLVITANLLAPW